MEPIIFVFIFSFIVIFLMLLSKIYEIKNNKKIVIFETVSHFDHNIRNLFHNAGHIYLDYKQIFLIFVKHQLPLHSKNVFNKTQIFFKEKIEKYIGNIRASKLLSDKSDGVSEFFKNISNIENKNSNDKEQVNKEEYKNDTDNIIK